VGSLQESFDTALISGSPFISIDNIRGKIDLPAIESFLTEDQYLARVPYASAAHIDPRHTIVMLTSNKAELTTDLANRSSCVRILKQPPGHSFKVFPEGDLLRHVRANQPQYLGAVFAIVRAWHKAGKPLIKESRHDFRRWEGILDWIVQNLLHGESIMKGHRDTQLRMADPWLTWLRELVLTIEKSGKASQWLRTHHLLDILDDAGLEIPGVEENDHSGNQSIRDKALLSLGQRLAKCFGPAGTTLEVDHLVIVRKETTDTQGRKRKEYLVKLANRDSSPASPRTPRDTSTSYTQKSAIASNKDESSTKCIAPRGGRGGTRERGVDADDTYVLSNEPRSAAEDSDEWGQL